MALQNVDLAGSFQKIQAAMTNVFLMGGVDIEII